MEQIAGIVPARMRYKYAPIALVLIPPLSAIVTQVGDAGIIIFVVLLCTGTLLMYTETQFIDLYYVAGVITGTILYTVNKNPLKSVVAIPVTVMMLEYLSASASLMRCATLKTSETFLVLKAGWSVVMPALLTEVLFITIATQCGNPLALFCAIVGLVVTFYSIANATTPVILEFLNLYITYYVFVVGSLCVIPYAIFQSA